LNFEFSILNSRPSRDNHEEGAMTGREENFGVFAVE